MMTHKFVLYSSLLLLITVGGSDVSGDSETPQSIDSDTSNDTQLASRDPLQAQFMMGVIALNNGDYEAAIAILSDLSKKTSSPRVRLDLARAFFLGRRFRDAKTVFQELLYENEVPLTVRQNIKLYLDEIDIVLGFVKFGFSIVSDSNPRNFTSSKEVMIAGQVLTITPPEDNREVRGVRYKVRSGKSLSDNGRLLGVANLSFTDFKQSQFDRWTGDSGLIYHFKSYPKLRSRLGLELSELDSKKQYDFPYIGFTYTPDPAHQFRLNHEFKIGRLHVPIAPHLNATNYNLTTNFYKPIGGDMLLKGDVGIETSSAKEDPYSYYGGSVGLGIDIPLNSWWVELFGAIGGRWYEEEDPFFDATRNDSRKKIGLTVKEKNFYLFGMRPEIGVLYEKNDSSIDFHSYDKLSFFVGFQE